jgi:predicted ATPase
MLKEIEIAGFKSIQKMKLAFNKINVLIGANGAGKSNFIELFKLLIAITNNRLQFYIGRNGGG